MRNVVNYNRVSTDEQAENGYSLDDQQEKLERTVERNGNNLLFNLREDCSAKTFNRPEWKKLMAYIKTNPNTVDLIMVLKWSRFSRNTTDAYNMIRELKSYGIEVNALEQPIDWKIPQSKYMLAFYLTEPEVDNDVRSKNVYDGMRRGNLSGRYLGPAPRGYKNARDSNDKPIIAPDENAIFVLEAFELIAENIYSQKEVIKILAGKGFHCSKTQFSVMLKNRHYTGKVFVKCSDDEPEKWIDGIHEPIITEELFFRVQEVLTGRAKRTNIIKVERLNESFPLRGYLECTVCGHKMTGSKSTGNGGGYNYYHCNPCKERYRADLINDAMVNTITEIQIEPEVKELYWDVIKDLLKDSDRDRKSKIKKWDADIEQQQQRINKLTDMVADGEMTSNDYGQAKKRYEDTINKMILQRTELSMVRTEFDEYVRWGLNLMENISGYYLASPVDVKQKIVGSIFTGNLQFSEGKLRTNALNQVVELICSPINELQENKTGQPPQNEKLSRLVPGAGIEPARSQ